MDTVSSVRAEGSDVAEVLPKLVLARGAALMFLLALLTGAYAAAALTGQLHVDARNALAAHVTAFLGAFWMISVAWTLPMLRYGAVGKLRMAVAVLVINVGGLVLNLAKSALRVEAIAAGGSAANTIIFVGLNVVVVIPALVVAVVWVAGFKSAAQLAREE